MLGTTGTFTSCKDYDDDINNLQTQVDGIKADLKTLQDKVNAGKYVTNVTKSGDGIVITWNDNSTSTIETIKGDKGEDGKAGTVVTIVDGFWAFDGVKSEYPAVGPKGDPGEPGAAGTGTAGADGHDAQISEGGYWMVWDAEAGEYVETNYIAGGVRAVETTGGYNLTVRDENGVEQTIFIPTSPALVGIEDVKNSSRAFAIFYGIVNEAVDWDGTKGGADKKMQTGMYPVLEDSVSVMLNPTGVDATAYKFDFKASDNKELWGLTFGDMVPYTGEKLTRAVSSENGIWVLPREIARVELNELNARADYVTQFKKNNGSLYAFALNATSKTDASKVIKSQYIYTFDPKNIGGMSASDFVLSFDRRNYVWNKYHTPVFDDWVHRPGGAVGDITGDVYLDQVIYDYKIEIDRTKMTQVDIDKYGLEISEDGYSFRTTKEASVDNYVDLTISFILINGSKATQPYRAYITAKDMVITDTNIGTINEAFNAVPSNSNIPALNGRYVLGAKELAFNPKEVLGANYDEWVDAMFNLLYNVPTDAAKASNLKRDVTILGGDPINNDAPYNDLLLRKFLYFDYVDASGNSCIYGVANDDVLSSLEAIAALKVYFIAGTYHPSTGGITNNADHSDDVTAPFYTVSGTASWSDGFAIPLDNAFSVQVDTWKEEQKVAAFTFKFQLTQPTTLDITRTNDKWTVWSGAALTSYGAYGDDATTDPGSEVKMYLPMYEAFKAWTTEYTVYDNQAKYYWLKQADKDNNSDRDVTFLGKAAGTNVHLDNDLTYTSTWSDWKTYTDDASVTYDATTGAEVEKKVSVQALFHHYGVYPEPKVANFDLTFASLLNHSTLKMAAGKETLVVNTGTHDVFISNDNLDLTTPMGGKFFLFDGLDKNENVVSRKTLNETSFNEEQRAFMTVDEIFNKDNFYARAKNGPAKGKPGVVEYQFSEETAGWTINPETGKRTYTIGDPDADNIKIYKIPAISKVKDTWDYLIDPEHTMIGGHTGGIVIQLPTKVADQEEVEITLTVEDGLGFTNDLTFTVKKIM